jgi:carboxyl-terminal processing protease
MLRRVLVGAVVLLTVSCGGSGGDDCSVDAQKDFVLDRVYDYYLFPERLPNSVNPDNFASADDLLDFLMEDAPEREQGRNFSFLTTAAEEQQFFDEGTAVAFGLGTLLRPGANSQQWRLFVSRVEPGSPAQEAGFVRGDEILAIGPSPNSMTQISSLTGSSAEVQADISALFGPSQSGIVRAFRVDPLTGPETTRTMTKRLIELDPVPTVTTLPRQGLDPVGFIALESFINPAEDQLFDAFADFQAQDVRDIIIDLRYNGGGLLSIAQTLADLLGAGLDGEPMFGLEFNDDHSDENVVIPFQTFDESILALNIAFITSNASASASELVINTLEPYANVAIIGDETFGKPVGQQVFELEDCGLVLRLVSFRTVNADGEGDYFEGLPDENFDGDFCPADDDLTAARGNVAEESTAVALSWLNNGVCPGAKAAPIQTLHPRAARPTLLNEHQPGLF